MRHCARGGGALQVGVWGVNDRQHARHARPLSPQSQHLLPIRPPPARVTAKPPEANDPDPQACPISTG
jgi:hypothetical protein